MQIERPENFADRICARSKETSPACVGLDPIPELMENLAFFDSSTPATLKNSLVTFGCTVVDASIESVAVIKPQSAHYEVWGMAGLMALAETIQYARSRNALLLLDAKRGDIASTATSYARAYLGDSHQQDFQGMTYDAMTVNPFLGRETLIPFVDQVSDGRHGIFVCTRTSNPGAGDIQDATVTQEGRSQSVSGLVADWLAGFAAEVAYSARGDFGYGPIGAVVGATYPEEARTLRIKLPECLFLVPGIGSQGGDVDRLSGFFDDEGMGAIVAASRSVTFANVDGTSPESYSASVRANAHRFAQRVTRASIA